MSYTEREKPIAETLNNRFRDSVTFDDNNVNYNKPDFKELDLGSPVSPLRTRTAGPTTSSSSSSSGSVSGRTGFNQTVKGPDSGPSSNNHSGELTSPTTTRNQKSGQPGVYSGGSVNSPAVNVLPTGNICPSGRILKTGMANRSSGRSDVLGSGSGNYGHGSIMRGGGGSCGAAKSGGGSGCGSVGSGGGDFGNVRSGKAVLGLDSEEVKKMGNEEYKRGNFGEALRLYDRAIALSLSNAAYRSNRAAALIGLGRIGEAVKECEEAVRLDPKYWRAHQRLGSLLLRLGQVENARRHICCPGQQPDPAELLKLQTVEKHLGKCSESRKVSDWRSILKDSDAAIAAGADYSPQIFTCRAEAFLKLHQLEDAESSLSQVPKFEIPVSCSRTRFFGMLSEAYLYFVRAKIEMALGRFDNAVTAVEKAAHADPQNIEIAMLLNKVRSVSRARSRGNELFKSERFTEACLAYEEGLRLDPANSVLNCNRAACYYKLGQWEHSLEDCNQALQIQPNYTKALLRRAASYSKLERWVEAVRDYETLRRELPDDNEVAESLFHAQVALRKSRGEEVYNMKFGGEVEDVSGLEQFRAALSSPGVTVVHFKSPSSLQCKQISPFVDTLCARYPSVNFINVDMEENPAVANLENVRIVPTFKIYKNGNRVKEMICPSPQVLEHSVRHYSF
ncbi:Tetratricopeptide repeat [Dillenia turbinata]|uniref:Tetratricopeptide repeat n=1 Tax=Dillenia turbinata TaxID=194707 RepID=A0AAN8ZDJ4_9MAGN